VFLAGKRDGEADGRAEQTRVAQNWWHLDNSQNGESQTNETKDFVRVGLEVVKPCHGHPDAATAQLELSLSIAMGRMGALPEAARLGGAKD